MKDVPEQYKQMTDCFVKALGQFGDIAAPIIGELGCDNLEVEGEKCIVTVELKKGREG